jgi:hypothetical protein
MTTAELIELFRGLSADNTPKYLWSDALLCRLASEAEKEAAVRSRLLVDSLTPDLCVKELDAGTRFLELDPRVVFIRRVKLASKEMPLAKIHRKDLDMIQPGWEDAPAGDTTNYCGNYTNGRIYFVQPLEADDTIRLTVVREPLAALALSGPAVNPEIPAYYHEKLVHWMFWRALYMRDVEEKYDPVAAKEQYNQFEGVFGPPLTARDRKWFQDEHGYDEFEGLY